MSSKIVIDNAGGSITSDGNPIGGGSLPTPTETGSVLVSNSSNQYIAHSASPFMRNRIINGAHMVSQRYADAPVQPSQNAYTTDRWVGGSNMLNSVAFDGAGDYLTVPANAALEFGGADFTVECWIYPISFDATSGTFIANGPQSGSASWQLSATNDGTVYFAAFSSGTTVLLNFSTASGVLSLNTWSHVAVTRSGNVYTIWVNGISRATSTVSGAIGNNGRPFYIAYGFATGAARYQNAYISNVRIVKGTALYTSAFTPSQVPLTAIANTSLLTCASSTLSDLSTNNFTVTAVGNAAVSTVNPFRNFLAGRSAGWSNYFDGSGDYLSVADNAALELSTGAFTIEMWVNTSATSGSIVAKGSNTNVNFGNLGLSVNANGTAGFSCNPNAGDSVGRVTLVSTSAVNTGTWNHIAITRNSTSWRLFVNGTQEATATSSVGFRDSTDPFYVGCTLVSSLPAQFFTGYISNVRVVKGTALYTSTFTPSTMPLVPVANTSLLTCASEVFQDKSSNDFTISTVGNAAVSSLSPFTAQAPAGFIGSLRWSVTAAASALASQNVGLFQRIEGTQISDLGWGTASAKSVTLSFWVRSSVAGIYCASVNNVGGAGAYSYCSEYTIAVANTWEKKTIAIPGPTVGTWLTTTGQGAAVRFDLGSGADNNGAANTWQAGNLFRTTNQTNFIGTALASGVQSNDFAISGVQLEMGSVATPFEFRPMQAELALCQRYYARLGSLSGNYVGFGAGVTNLIGAQQVGYCYVALPQPMRTAPSPTLSNVCLYDTAARAATYYTHVATTETIAIAVTATGLTTGRAVILCGNNNPNAYIELNAEL